MTSDNPNPNAPHSNLDESLIDDILGYLNFSNGTTDAKFQQNLNQACLQCHSAMPAPILKAAFLQRLSSLNSTNPAFADCEQAESIILIVFDQLLSDFQQHHADLLFHLAKEDFQRPLFLVRLFEAALQQGAPWTDSERIVSSAISQLNDFLGYRPVAILDNDREMQPYSHERFRPIPLYTKEAGVSVGLYHDLIERTIRFFDEVPAEIIQESHFNLDHLDELALDVRAHDHQHPMNKRTNYMFGEWDPHLIDNRGFYRRFVIRKIILDALIHWLDESQKPQDIEESLYDASAVLCGTILMASSISGAGPNTYDSSVTLTSLLPHVAHQRDAFYAQLLNSTTGPRSDRLSREAEMTQQPFGHVRQSLNMHLSRYGSHQIQHRHIAQLYAIMGFPEAAQAEAASIPSLACRFETEIHRRISNTHQLLAKQQLSQADELIKEIEDWYDRGIECGAFVDPWNILSFQGHFPLFHTREDSVPDHRIEFLIDLTLSIFNIFTRAMIETASQGDTERCENLSTRFRKMAEQWDQYATTTVEEIPPLNGLECWESATHISSTLAEWMHAGEEAGDISFWKQRLDRFQSAQSYSQVIDALLEKQDQVASMGLLMQWLSQADSVGLQTDSYAFDDLLLRWMSQVTEHSRDTESSWTDICRLFDYLEANAEDYWSAPKLSDASGLPSQPENKTDGPSDFATEFPDEEPDSDEENSLYQAAYDDVVFRDSAEDGHLGDTLDDGFGQGTTEFELINRVLEPKLKFLNTLTLLWQQTSYFLFSQVQQNSEASLDIASTYERISDWANRTTQLKKGLTHLLFDVWKNDISFSSGDHDANIEFDIQLQVKLYLLHTITVTIVGCRHTQKILLSYLPEGSSSTPQPQNEFETLITQIYRGVFRRDVETVRSLLPSLNDQLQGKALLYIPFDRDGHPQQILEARTLQAILRFLLAELPRIGLIEETSGLLLTAQRMERASRLEGLAVSEFSPLFRTGLQNSLDCILTSADDSELPAITEPELLNLIVEVIDRYQEQWLSHSQTMRLSTIEALLNEQTDSEIESFIKKYGADFFHAADLTLGFVRAILHNGIDEYLDFLQENEDPLHPHPLLTDLENGSISRESAIRNLELVYEIVVDRFDRFIEYNNTTTQSDYGEKFYCLLEFLKLEAQYERDSWNAIPFGIAHQAMVQNGNLELAKIWEQLHAEKNHQRAEEHLFSLQELETQYGMRLPAVSDLLNERFIKPFAVNRMLALVGPSIRDAREENFPSKSFESLELEISNYVSETTGSGIDLPGWLQKLERKVDKIDEQYYSGTIPLEHELSLPPISIDLNLLSKQLQNTSTEFDEENGPDE